MANRSAFPQARYARRMLFLLLITLLLALAATTKNKPLTRANAFSARSVWYRGSTHTHTNNSFDGESSPVAVATAYRARGYNFLFLTDHNKLTSVEDVNAQVGVPGQFLAIKGEEITDSANGKPVHLIGLNNTSLVMPQHGSSVLNTLQADIDAVTQAGGVSIVAHPNYQFALSNTDLNSVTGTIFFEVYNAHPHVNNTGDATHSSVEDKWDDALSSGKLLYGLAADDEHTLTNPAGPLPGRGWVMVRAASLDADSIMQAMANGDFYASTGVTLQDYQVTSSGITITVDAGSAETATIDFFGRSGQLLQRSTANPSTYTFTGHEQYVRAKILNSNGQAAWTQPVYTERLNRDDAVLNAASMGHEPAAQRTIAPDSVALASGVGLAGSAMQAQRQTDGRFPSTLGGTTVTVNDRPAEVYYVSSRQLSFHVPEETELGLAQVVLTNADGIQMRSQITVSNAAPGVFTFAGDGMGNAVTFDLDNLFGSVLMPDSYWHRFYVYATGVRGADNVQVLINGLPVAVEAVKSCRGLPGLDQITIVIPRNLTAPGDSLVVIQADGMMSNSATLHF